MFSGWDWAVFVVFLTASLSIGWVAGLVQRRNIKKGEEDAEFLMGGRSLNPVAVAMSTLVGAMSTNMVLGNPAEMYSHGTQLWLNLIGLSLGFIYVHKVVLRVLYPLKITSVYTYIEKRFQSRFLTSFAIITTMIGTFFYMGLVSYSPSLAMQTVTGFPTWGSIIVLGLICTIYSSWGGVRAVVYTDILQTFVMFSGIIVIMVLATVEVGGLDEVWKIADEHGRVEWWNINPDPLQRHSVWTVTVQGYFTALIVFGMGQPQVQRILSVNKWNKAIFAHYLDLLMLLALYSCCNYMGVAVFAVYADCDPMATGDIDKPDEILPYYVTDKLSGFYGLPGLFIAALYAGSLSSYSSQINAVSAVMWEGYFKNSSWVENMPQHRRPYVNILVSVVTGLLGILAGIIASQLGGIFQVGQIILGTIHSPLFGVFVLGMCCPFANKVGGIVGFTTSLLFNLWITLGATFYGHAPTLLPFSDEGCNSTTLQPDSTFLTTFPTTLLPTTTTEETPEDDYVFPLYLVSYTLYYLFGVSITFTIGAIVSLLYKPWSLEESGEAYIHPTFYKLQKWWETRNQHPDPTTSTNNLVPMEKM
ncbi:hypothetical protein Pcinc_036746 [Petrolisthes cinctipes]|uniref:Sodium-coupled monocarboxylate transporter 1 n=1 Tax=Petrolisthes cinctipes TaxID=88211 RepID=A0AAE1BTT4_PETCI|nr:hypothetical protein Pcinc_038918 [Petrolisthes cinctipes]KAK3856972.1 hypothetical protein Pcinc_036746 [Petrolisthes cinctipes]